MPAPPRKLFLSDALSLVAAQAHSSGIEGEAESSEPVPELVVFDLDMCTWSPEMFSLHKPPSMPVSGDLSQAADSTMLPVAGAPVGMGMTCRAMQGVVRFDSFISCSILLMFHSFFTQCLQVGASNGQDTVRLFPVRTEAILRVL